MQTRRKLAGALGLLAVAGTVAALGAGPILVTASDHLDAPLVKTDGRIDITDLYAFANSGGQTSLILNVNPLLTPGMTKAARFRQMALYEFKIDTNGDAKADIAYRVEFSNLKLLSDGAAYQTYVVKRATGTAANRHEWSGATIAVGTTTAYGHSLRTATILGGGKAFAGPRDDPFYFDLVGFKHLKTRLLAGSTTIGSPGDAACTDGSDTMADHLLSCFTGADTFAGTNISSIVLQVPNSRIGGTGHAIGVWATTSISTAAGWLQIDRQGRPAINTVFNITDGQKELTNLSSPRDDRSQMLARTKAVLGAFNNVLAANSLNTYSAGQIAAIAGILLPDELTYKVGDHHSFAWFSGPVGLGNLHLNGRKPADDVINAEFGLVTDFQINSDGVDANDVSFPPTFPYLAAPH
ncbi:MAG: DUF4331 domain-containing protein [Chloroflexota bacterium]|nr:DUF4331 domain-containing protein [Chloroflexota bacterium]